MACVVSSLGWYTSKQLKQQVLYLILTEVKQYNPALSAVSTRALKYFIQGSH
jgi:hypothetical protein